MKKLLVLFAAAAFVLPFLSSCDPEDKPTQKVIMEPAPTAEVAQVFTFEEKPLYAMNGQKHEIVSIEFTEDNRYILGLSPVIDGSSVKPDTKASKIGSVVTGKFTLSGNKFITQGEYQAQMELLESVAKIVGTGEFKGKRKMNSSTTPEEVNANRTWIVDNTYIKITGGVNAEAGFKGCDFQEIAQFLKDNGAKIDPSKVAGYKISEMEFTGSGSMNIAFSATSSFYGSYTLSGENITYSFVVINNNDILAASASGKLTFPANKKAELILNTTIGGYNGTVQFSMHSN
ncbi:MAG: hypothetical protein J5508_06730 [Bacteroidales bacterium]|nr:hypothetical protein [Bacteroidales bacterium]